MNISRILEEQEVIRKYIKTRKRIQRLLLRKTFNNTQEKEVANYIFRLSEKLEDIEERLKFRGIIKAEENLAEWSTRRLEDFLL